MGNFVNGLLESREFFPDPKRRAGMILIYSCSLVARRIDFHVNIHNHIVLYQMKAQNVKQQKNKNKKGRRISIMVDRLNSTSTILPANYV